MSNFTKAIVLSNIEFNALISDIFRYFYVDFLYDYYNENTKKIEITKKELKEMYEEFKTTLESEYEIMLDSYDIEFIMVYIDGWVDINNEDQFVYLALQELNIENEYDFIKLIQEEINDKIEIKEDD